MKKENIYVIIIMILVLAVGVLAVNNRNKVNDNQEVTENNNVDNNYIRYTDSKNDISDDLNIKIKNKKLVMTYENKNIPINNLPENIKYFTYVIFCGGDMELASLDYDGNVYYSYFDINAFDKENLADIEDVIKHIDFEKVEGEKVKDITVKELPIFSTCGNDAIYVITEDNKEKAIDYDEEKEKVVVGNEYSVDYPYLSRIGGLVGLYLYRDGKVGFDSKNKYLDINAKVIYQVKFEEYGNTNNEFYIIDTNNKLYNVIYTMNEGRNIKNISLKLVSDKVIKSINTKNVGTYFCDSENPIKETITYTDNTTYELKNVEELYYLKKI